MDATSWTGRLKTSVQQPKAPYCEQYALGTALYLETSILKGLEKSVIDWVDESAGTVTAAYGKADNRVSNLYWPKLYSVHKQMFASSNVDHVADKAGAPVKE